jgi:hypothetical protein
VSDRESKSVELPGSPEPLPSYASVTIIGGGAMGVSTAYHLAQGGVGSILVIERDLLGSGSSAKPLGGVEQRSRIQATSCWRSAASKRTSDSQASSGSTSAFDKSDTCCYAGPGRIWPRSNRQPKGDSGPHEPWRGEDRHCDLYRRGLVAAHRRDGGRLVARCPGTQADRLDRTADAANANCRSPSI